MPDLETLKNIAVISFFIIVGVSIVGFVILCVGINVLKKGVDA